MAFSDFLVVRHGTPAPMTIARDAVKELAQFVHSTQE